MGKRTDILEKYQDQTEIWYKIHNIIRERSELYCDFFSSLLLLIDETYLGPDILKLESDILNHFNWCFNKVISNFEKERIYFVSKGSHHEYLWDLFNKWYYMSEMVEKCDILLEYFDLLFNFGKIKTPSEIEIFTDVYKIMDKNLKKMN
jgi:hypothetical protein